jgi:hypothetical protein
MVWGEASLGIGQWRAPITELRLVQPSMRLTLPRAPEAKSSRAFAYTTELTHWLPTCRMRPVFFWASSMRTPSSMVCIIGFSQ